MFRFKDIIFACMFFFLLNAPLAPQLKEPSVDDVPDVEFNITENSELYKAKVTLYGREPFPCEISLSPGATINPSSDRTRLYPLSEISRITVTSWSKQRNRGGWVFYPENYDITLRNGTKIIHIGNIGFLNRMKVSYGKKKGVYLYTYYYDYFRKGKWVNTGTEGEGTPPERPADGCLYIIELN